VRKEAITLIFKVRVKVTLRREVYRPSVRLGAKPLEITTRDFFNLTLGFIVLMHISDERMSLPLVNMPGFS
jgi:hypothetical protein